MYARIVVGTDGSATADKAVDHAIGLAALAGCPLEIVTGYEPASERDVERAREAGAPPDVALSRSTPGEVVLDAAAERARTRGVKVTTHAVEGGAAESLVQVAQRTGADLVVVGSVGMTGAMRFVTGSVPNAVAHRLPTSVLIVKTN